MVSLPVGSKLASENLWVLRAAAEAFYLYVILALLKCIEDILVWRIKATRIDRVVFSAPFGLRYGAAFHYLPGYPVVGIPSHRPKSDHRHNRTDNEIAL